ncbi:MAG: hypothetical protein JO006_16175 [Paucibacter sp.]|nr:hypothetical protein [Roseateles sp.]
MRPALQGVGGLGRPTGTLSIDAPASSDSAPTPALDQLLALLPARTESGSAAREPGLQLRIGALQQGADYLDRLAQGLQALKQQLSSAMARSDADTGALQAGVDRLEALWQARSAEAGGQLNAQLQPPSADAAADAAAQQRFRVRGLDADSLQASGAETLRVQVPGQAGTLRVQIDGGSTAQGAKALRDALAPAGVQVQAQGGQLWFSVDELRWPALQDGLRIQGGGRRFPGGQAVRPALDPAPAAIDTRRWQLGSLDERRATLRGLTQAQAQTAAARKGYGAALSQAAEVVQGEAPSAADAAQLADGLGRTMQQADFKQVAALSPALRGLHRERVRQILSST